jgi:hypothetical protein
MSNQGLPVSMLSHDNDSIYSDKIEYLGHYSTPSGITMEQNAYILNIQTPSGGYIDGLALHTIDGIPISVCDYSYTHTSYHAKQKARFDRNPSCCGHLINHSIRYQNVDVLPFAWSDVVLPLRSNTGYINKRPQYTKRALASIPNAMRQDGEPRYMFNGDIIRYASSADTVSRIQRVHGAVIYATKHIGPDQELFLHYKLQQHPLPEWAATWYNDAE